MIWLYVIGTILGYVFFGAVTARAVVLMDKAEGEYSRRNEYEMYGLFWPFVWVGALIYLPMTKLKSWVHKDSKAEIKAAAEATFDAKTKEAELVLAAEVSETLAELDHQINRQRRGPEYYLPSDASPEVRARLQVSLDRIAKENVSVQHHPGGRPKPWTD